MLITLVKQPAEVLRPAPAFDTSAPIAAVLATSVATRGLVAAAAALVAEATITAGVVTLAVRGGTDGERYLVTVRVRDQAAAELESEVEVAVVDGAWAMPDGGAAWLSIDAFVRKFGLPEVVAMTDGSGAGRIDRALLIAALTDAQAIAEAEVAGRYALPLATVPAVVQLAIADIARARLYPRGAPDGVAEAAKAATRTLERIGSGALKLGVPAADAPAEAVTEAPVVFIPGRRQYPDGLADY